MPEFGKTTLAHPSLPVPAPRDQDAGTYECCATVPCVPGLPASGSAGAAVRPGWRNRGPARRLPGLVFFGGLGCVQVRHEAAVPPAGMAGLVRAVLCRLAASAPDPAHQAFTGRFRRKHNPDPAGEVRGSPVPDPVPCKNPRVLP